MRKLMGTSTGWIKPRDYGRVIENGIEYQVLYSPTQKIILRVARTIQSLLWKVGVAVYNPVSGECTIDFNCCGYGRHAWFRWHPKGK